MSVLKHRHVFSSKAGIDSVIFKGRFLGKSGMCSLWLLMKANLFLSCDFLTHFPWIFKD